jgi:hypothetical protein
LIDDVASDTVRIMPSLKPHRVLVHSLAPVFVVVLLGATLPQGLPNYLNGSAPQLTSVGAARHDHWEQSTYPVPPDGTGIPSAALAYSFVRFDRKQNTRLWPFVSAGINRSPPLHA